MLAFLDIEIGRLISFLVTLSFVAVFLVVGLYWLVFSLVFKIMFRHEGDESRYQLPPHCND